MVLVVLKIISIMTHYYFITIALVLDGPCGAGTGAHRAPSSKEGAYSDSNKFSTTIPKAIASISQ